MIYKNTTMMFNKVTTCSLAAWTAFMGVVAASMTGSAASGIAESCATLASGCFTYYDPGPGGRIQTHTSSDLVVALNYVDFDLSMPNGNPNNDPFCCRRIRALYGGKSIDVPVVDHCPGCLDLSPAFFQRLANLDAGVLQGIGERI
ncbi:hypothetical protein VTI74DRAFT_612 [Chaetomium olivicolor]